MIHFYRSCSVVSGIYFLSQKNFGVCRCSATHVQWRVWGSVSLVGGLSHRLCEVQDPSALSGWEASGLHEDLHGCLAH